MKPQARILARNEAQQMAADLGTAMDNVIMLAEDATDPEKVLAFDTLRILLTKRHILEGEIAHSDREQSQGGAP